jgi:Nuclease-related domain
VDGRSAATDHRELSASARANASPSVAATLRANNRTVPDPRSLDAVPQDLSMISYPRRQVFQRLLRVAAAAGAALTTALLAALALAVGAGAVAGLLLLVATGLVAYARHWVRLAGRSRVGAQSERQVHRALQPLEAEGWRLRHSIPWHGCGDIDHVAIGPRQVGFAFAIETKTQTYRREHIARAAATARWLASRRQRWCPRGAFAVLCLVRAGGVQRVEGDILVVSIDRLPAALRCAAGTRTRPAFLSAASV